MGKLLNLAIELLRDTEMKSFIFTNTHLLNARRSLWDPCYCTGHGTGQHRTHLVTRDTEESTSVWDYLEREDQGGFIYLIKERLMIQPTLSLGYPATLQASSDDRATKEASCP